MGRTVGLFMLVALSAWNAATVLAADNSAAGSPENYELRMEFIENRLEENRRAALYWQNGWTAFYAVSSVAQAALWIDANDSDDKVNYGVGALKSAAGFADMLLRPHPGRLGKAPLQEMPRETQEQRSRRLDAGETLLLHSAERAASRRSWQPHLKILGVNLVAGALIAAFGDKGDAVSSTALGLVIGEANIWTLPARPEADWNEYQRRFPRPGSGAGVNWQLVPVVGGVVLQGSF